MPHNPTMIDTLLMAAGYLITLAFGTTLLHWIFPRRPRFPLPRLRRPYVQPRTAHRYGRRKF